MLKVRQNPIIIIGMHRSGTSMIARMLEKLGLFVGHRKDQNHEARFFLDINNWLLNQSGGSWDNPSSVDYLLKHSDASELCKQYIQFLTSSWHLHSYLGWRQYLRYRDITRIDFLWGWKDPRNTFTLPLWLALFPEAKVIHLHRHGVDVARSLQMRLNKHWQRYRKPNWNKYSLRLKRGGFAPSLRCSSVEGAFTLWQEYTLRAKQHVERLGSQAFELKYEDFLKSPAQKMGRICRFCGLEATEAQIASLVKDVNASRAYAYKTNIELASFAEKKEEMAIAMEL